jgi:hypothetical protein
MYEAYSTTLQGLLSCGRIINPSARTKSAQSGLQDECLNHCPIEAKLNQVSMKSTYKKKEEEKNILAQTTDHLNP